MKIFGLVEKFKALVGVRQASAPNVDSNDTAFYADTNGLPKVVIDTSGTETDHHLAKSQNGGGAITLTTPSSAATSYTLPTSGTTIETTAGSASAAAAAVSSHNISSGIHGVTGTLVGTSDSATLTNKIYNGEAAGDTAGSGKSKLIVPKESTSNLAALTKTEACLVFDSTTKKLNVGDGSNWKVVGGGLLTEAKGTGSFNAEAGKWYLVDMDGASANSTITLPVGAAESVVQISVKNNPYPTYKLIVDGSGSETIWYNDAANANVEFAYPEMTATFAWDTNDSHWVVAVSQTPLSGRWSGSLDMTGTLKVDTIQAHTSGAGVKIEGRESSTAVEAGCIGELKYSGTHSAKTPASGAFTTINSISLGAGIWDVSGGGNCVVASGNTTSNFGVSISKSDNAVDVFTAETSTFLSGLASGSGSTLVAPTPTRRIELAATTPVYLIGRSDWSGDGTNTWAANGSYIRAIRVG